MTRLKALRKNRRKSSRSKLTTFPLPMEMLLKSRESKLDNGRRWNLIKSLHLERACLPKRGKRKRRSIVKTKLSRRLEFR